MEVKNKPKIPAVRGSGLREGEGQGNACLYILNLLAISDFLN